MRKLQIVEFGPDCGSTPPWNGLDWDFTTAGVALQSLKDPRRGDTQPPLQTSARLRDLYLHAP